MVVRLKHMSCRHTGDSCVAQEYSFEDFLDHFRAMKHVLKYDRVHTDYNDLNYVIEVGDDHSMEMNMGRVLDYFGQLGYSDGVKEYQAPRLLMILMYLAEHLLFFSQEGFAGMGFPGGPSEVSPSLLRALHEHFAKPGLPRETTPQAIVERARRIEADEEGDT